MAAFGLPMGGELWIILIIVLILFGPSQLPKLAKMVGKSAKALKEGMEQGLDESESKPESANSEEKSSEKTE
ncbi:MAG: twin-arginine translocase TatA/TatE family subunit [Anaerosomatales bacterium]|nr:twin-arginine translocase TatA/TatE family subunit [Coriobacteriia bacterium]MDI6692375.1 twin-arginine translocase TatA/TatE family subunit [Anaerosomatales bacterium]